MFECIPQLKKCRLLLTGSEKATSVLEKEFALEPLCMGFKCVTRPCIFHLPAPRTERQGYHQRAHFYRKSFHELPFRDSSLCMAKNRSGTGRGLELVTLRLDAN